MILYWYISDETTFYLKGERTLERRKRVKIRKKIDIFGGILKFWIEWAIEREEEREPIGNVGGNKFLLPAKGKHCNYLHDDVDDTQKTKGFTRKTSIIKLTVSSYDDHLSSFGIHYINTYHVNKRQYNKIWSAD